VSHNFENEAKYSYRDNGRSRYRKNCYIKTCCHITLWTL